MKSLIPFCIHGLSMEKVCVPYDSDMQMSLLGIMGKKNKLNYRTWLGRCKASLPSKALDPE